MAGERTHELKTWPAYFEAILRGEKRHECRLNDRDYRVGDVLVLREWDYDRHSLRCMDCAGSMAYTGRSLRARVTYVSPGGQWGVQAAYVVMSIAVARFCKDCERKTEAVRCCDADTWPLCSACGEDGATIGGTTLCRDCDISPEVCRG